MVKGVILFLRVAIKDKTGMIVTILVIEATKAVAGVNGEVIIIATKGKDDNLRTHRGITSARPMDKMQNETHGLEYKNKQPLRRINVESAAMCIYNRIIALPQMPDVTNAADKDISFVVVVVVIVPTRDSADLQEQKIAAIYRRKFLKEQMLLMIGVHKQAFVI